MLRKINNFHSCVEPFSIFIYGKVLFSATVSTQTQTLHNYIVIVHTTTCAFGIWPLKFHASCTMHMHMVKIIDFALPFVRLKKSNNLFFLHQNESNIQIAHANSKLWIIKCEKDKRIYASYFFLSTINTRVNSHTIWTSHRKELTR